jgi:hypothetical protein
MPKQVRGRACCRIGAPDSLLARDDRPCVLGIAALDRLLKVVVLMPARAAGVNAYSISITGTRTRDREDGA